MAMLEFIKNNINDICIPFIIIVFFIFIYEAFKVLMLSRVFNKANKDNDRLEALSDKELNTIKFAYQESISIKTDLGVKTNVPSSEFFSEFKICKSKKINMRMLDAASGTLVGLGLLGTFLGLTLGVEGFDSSNTENIQKSIQLLLNGMGTAFYTSLFGMSLSLIYTVADKYCRNELSKELRDFTDKLDLNYYIDDTTLYSIYQQQNLKPLFSNIKDTLDEHTKTIMNLTEDKFKALEEKLVYVNGEGKNVTIANAIREILIHNEQQSKALKSFSTDLAIELNNGFDESLSRQMQQKILPLMENVDTTTKAIVEHIDRMAEQVSAPATDMIQNVVDELKNSMTVIIDEFKESLSTSATNELENLAVQLGTATQAMADFPKNMGNISAILQVTIEEVKNAISEISHTSANANSTAMQQMQEQIAFATGAISNAITEVREVMNGITNSSQQQSNQMVDKMADAAEKMSNYLSDTVAALSSSISDSVKGITDDINHKQENMLMLQQSMLEKIESTMNGMTQNSEKQSNQMIDKMMNAAEQMNTNLNNTVVTLSSTVSDSVKGITDDINRKQENMFRLQQSMMEKIESTVNGMTQASTTQNNQMVGKLAEAAEQMGAFLNKTVSSLSASVQDSMKNITADVNNKQADLIALQEETITQTRRLLETFNHGLERLEKMNESISGTMNMFQKAQGEISGSAAHLQIITGDMKQATQLFNKSQSEYSDQMEKMQRNSQQSIDAVTQLLNDSGEMSQEYIEKFEIIKQGISNIFTQLQAGLSEYSKTVQATTQRYLDQYSSSLTSTTDALSSTIQQQNEVVEMLVESINSRKY